MTELNNQRLLELPIDIWKHIAHIVFRGHNMEYNEHDIYCLYNLSKQQKHLVKLSNSCILFRRIFRRFVFRNFLLLVDREGKPLSCPDISSPDAKYIQTLYIRVDTNAAVDPCIIKTHILSLVSKNFIKLKTITIDASVPVIPDYSFTPTFSVPTINFPKLSSVQLVCNLSGEAASETSRQAALHLAHEIVHSLSARDWLQSLEWNLDAAANVSYAIVAPKWAVNINKPHTGYIPQISVLQFSDTSLVVQSVDLIRACADTLRHLTFMLCDYESFRRIIYSQSDSSSNTEIPMVYPRLKAIHGALRRRNPSLEVYSVSSDTFPNLEYLHEAIEHTWQNRLGAIPHLLVNTLLTTTLSRLRTLRLRMSNDMDLRAEQVPSLEYVSYYRYSRFLDDISGTVIARQFSQLLQIKSLQFLRFHDRIPPIQLNTHLDVECLDLRHLDLGFIILPLYNVVRLLCRLTYLHTAAFAVYNQWQPNDFTIDDDEPISNSVERLIMYIIEPTHTSPTDIVPSVEIMTRLPKLHKLYLQPGVESASAVFNRMKEIERFSWSAEVTERVEIDIFDNY